MIVTLTTDFGSRDHYAATLKGRILCAAGEVCLVDITHHINTYDIVAAAYTLRNCYRSFPHGTVHIVIVDNYYDEQVELIAVQHDGYYFLLPDNGLLSLIIDTVSPEAAYHLPRRSEGTKGGIKQRFANAVAHIAAAQPFAEIGIPAHDLVQRIALQPVVSKDQIKGCIIHIDNYENCILNITRESFSIFQIDQPFHLYFKRNNPITKLSEHYQDAPIGETLCRFNSAGYLEIAVNMGKAATLLGLNVEDTVQLIFNAALVTAN